jgi:hypothetical protein
MAKDFKIADLIESDEIQKSYDQRDYFNTVLKCRVFLESWLGEYIYALLFPFKEQSKKENRQFVNKRFNDMFYQIQWLSQNDYITKNDYANLNRLRTFSERVFRKGDVLKIYNMKELDDFILVSIHYCGKYKAAVKQIFENEPEKSFDRF